MLPVKTQISLCIRAVWSVFVVCMKKLCILWSSKMHPVWILSRLCESESSLGVHVPRNVFWRCGTYFCKYSFLVSILHKSIAGRYWPLRVADGPITARCRFIKNASWVRSAKVLMRLCGCIAHAQRYMFAWLGQYKLYKSQRLCVWECAEPDQRVRCASRFGSVHSTQLMHNVRKGPFSNLWTTQTLISLLISAGCSGPSLTSYRISGYRSIC